MSTSRPSGSGGAGRPRLYIVEFDLADLSGHFFDQALGFIEAAHSHGMDALVFTLKGLEPSLAEALDAQTILEPPLDPSDRDGQIEALTEEQSRLDALWESLKAQELSKDDIVLFTSARPASIYAVANWLAVLPYETRPVVFFRFFGPEFLDPHDMKYNDRAWLYRFVSRELALRPGHRRVFFTINNSRLVEALERLCTRRVFQMPVPKYHGSDLDIDTPDAQPRTVIYVHLNLRSGNLLTEITEIMRSVLLHRSDVEFLVKATLNAKATGLLSLDGNSFEGRVTLVPAEQSPRDFLSTIARSHIVLLPYESVEYRAIASGVLCEAAGQGKVIIAPDKTWMADQITQGRASGILFAEPAAANIAAAILTALENLPQLATEAKQKGEYFQREHSCERNVELMLELAREAPDMRPTYSLGSMIDFACKFSSRCYLLSGWSVTEADHGVWSDGPVAELVFRVEPKPAGSLLLRVHLSAFVVPAHPDSHIGLFVNGSGLAQWNFSLERIEQAHRVWCEARIPVEIASNDEIRIELRIAHPASPRQLGLSVDSRQLGIMLHEMSISTWPTQELRTFTSKATRPEPTMTSRSS